jgi:TorA maturation chaperone TorD
MNELTDKELIRIRLRFLDVIKSFFMDEPDAERLSRWRGFVAALSNEPVNPLMDAAVKELGGLLSEINLEDIRDEYYELFINPFSNDMVQTNLSHYIDGQAFGQTLVNFRGLMMEAGLVKNEDVDDTEDSLVFMLDVLRTLIEEEKNDPEEARTKQTKVLNEYLDPLTTHFRSAMKENSKGHFYKACAGFLSGYVDLEKGLTAPL